ncbi:MAG TPA: carboxylesterase family protein [Polyangiaceae bacterium]|nr:carboxylesterase family protein [Polyangiaceae bacterium]
MRSALRLDPRAVVSSAKKLAAILVALAATTCGGSEPADSSTSGAGGSSGSGGSGGSGGAGGSSSSGPNAACDVADASDPLVAPTVHGAVRGKKDGDVLAFLGVPYAAPPVGPLRFKAPEAPACWEDVRDATAFGSACVQNMPTGGAAGTEDCLYLNIWTPAKSGPPRPVLFFVHGGALLFGSGAQDLFFEETGNIYRGQTLASEHDVVVVTINYRLAELGFLAHPSLTKEDPNGSSGNYGPLDQIAALRWVKDNIAAFGGDPSRVMLFGESAGGLSTCLLMSSPLAKGLFSSAIIESGGCSVASREGRYAQGTAIVDTVGCTGSPDVPSCLRGQDVDAFRVPPPTGINLFLADSDINSAWDMPFGPNLDGYVFEEQPLQAIREGRHNKVPLAVGSNATEFELFIPIGTVNSCGDYWTLIGAIFGGLADEVLAQYSCFDYPLPRRAAVAVGTDFMFTCPARRILRATLSGGTPAAYRYYYPHKYSNSPLTALKSFHAAELPFVFRTFDVLGYEPTAGDTALSKAMGGYWTRFAAAGDPNGGADLLWPAYGEVSDTALVLDDSLSTQSSIASDHCDFWDSLATD